MKIFDKKIWNDAVFQKYVDTVPNTKLNELIKSGAIRQNQALASRLVDGVGGSTLIEPFKAAIGGDAINYDGATNITGNARETFMQKKIAIGRAKGFEEKDFSQELSGVDFRATAQEVQEYFQGVDQDDLLAILEGIFAMNSTEGAAFVDKHTYEADEFGAGTLNLAAQKALGDHKKNLELIVMHSVVATNLENLRLVDYLKYTDANGIQRDLGLATLNGKLVLVDDQMPVENVEADGETPAHDLYTSYVLGKGAIEYADLGAKVPNELVRDALTDGGIDMIVARRRKVFAPAGITWAGADSIVSPTVAQLKAAGNWDLVNNGLTASNKVVIDDKLVPFVRIITKK